MKPGNLEMNVNFPPESLLNQGSGTKNALENPTMIVKIDSSTLMCNERHFSVSHSLASPKNNAF